MHKLKNKKIAVVVSTPMTAFVFLSDQIQSLAMHSDVTLVANFSDAPEFHKSFPKITVVDIGINRDISPLSDLCSLWCLYRLFVAERFDVVHSVSPKAGLLAMLASAAARVKVRLHTFTGQVWVTRKGSVRVLLKNLDRLIGYCATSVLVDSHSQRDFLLDERVVQPARSFVLGSGSISGVDTMRFSCRVDRRQSIRSQLGIDDSDILLLFLGRLKIDKGVLDLAAAFNLAAKYNDSIKLLYVGPDEESLEAEIRSTCSLISDRLFFVSYTSSPEDYMSAADLFCLPSYREGFGSVVIEAAACGLPSIASNIYGLSDAVEDGVTGVLVAPRDVEALAKAISVMTDDNMWRLSLGAAAKQRAHECFSHELLTRELIDFYKKQLN